MAGAPTAGSATVLATLLATERAGMLGSEAVVTGTTFTVSLPA